MRGSHNQRRDKFQTTCFYLDPIRRDVASTRKTRCLPFHALLPNTRRVLREANEITEVQPAAPYSELPTREEPRGLDRVSTLLVAEKYVAKNTLSARVKHTRTRVLGFTNKEGGGGRGTSAAVSDYWHTSRHPFSQLIHPLRRSVRSCQISVGVPWRTSTKSA